MSDELRAKVEGDRNVVIQNTGPNAIIKVGVSATQLAIVPPNARVSIRAAKSEVDLLNPYNRTIDVRGRNADLESLNVWLRSKRAVSVRTIIGRAGAGKTRIAIELMHTLPAEGRDAWDAGFVRSEELLRFIDNENLSEWELKRPALIVLDYAASSAAVVKRFLCGLADRSGRANGACLRLLLIERDANCDSGWLSTVLGAGFSDARLRDLFDPLEPLSLEPLGHTDRRAVFEAMLEVAAKHANRPVPAVPTPGDDANFERRLLEPIWADPLYLMMAALTGVTTGVAAALSLSRTELADALAKRELERIAKFAEPGDPKGGFLMHMAGYATLCGGLAYEAALRAAKEESVALALDYPGGPGAAVARLFEALPGPESGLAPITPDIIGEAAVLRALRARPASVQQDTVSRAVRLLDRPVLATLVRLIQDFSASGATEPLAWIEHLIRTGAAEDMGILLQIESVLPKQTLALREKAAEVTQLLLDWFSDIPEALTEDLNSEKARLLNNLAIRLSALGRREEALEHAEEAVRLYRALASARPDAFLPNLATSLNNLAVMLSALGRREEALERVEEAVRIRRELALARPDAFLPDLAMSLGVLSLVLSALGRPEEAAARLREALVGLLPYFERYPQAHAGLMARLFHDYLNACGASGAEPEGAVLTPIMNVFDRLKGTEKET